MDTQHTGRMGARHLSQIQEESDSREHSTTFLPPIAQEQLKQPDGEEENQEVRHLSDPSSGAVCDQQQKLEENRSLLEELTHIEAELRESLRLDEERQQESQFLRQQGNQLLWQSLCFLSLSQRVAKPWVSSYFRTFPMHIYCLPVQHAGHKGQRRGQKKRR
ncbi:uncharacterized protein ACNS7B_001863 [Menidia menidia]